MEGVYIILDFLTGESLMTHHLPTASNFVKEGLLKQLSLDAQKICAEWIHTDDWEKKIAEVDETFGEIELQPVDKTGFEKYMIDNSLLK